MAEMFNQPDMTGLSEEEKSQVLMVLQKAKVTMSPAVTMIQCA